MTRFVVAARSQGEGLVVVLGAFEQFGLLDQAFGDAVCDAAGALDSAAGVRSISWVPLRIRIR